MDTQILKEVLDGILAYLDEHKQLHHQADVVEVIAADFHIDFLTVRVAIDLLVVSRLIGKAPNGRIGGN